MKNTKRRKTHVEKVADAQQRQYAKVQPAHQALLLGPVDGLVVGVLGQRLGVELRVGVVDGVDNGPLDVAIDLDMLGVGVKRLGGHGIWRACHRVRCSTRRRCWRARESEGRAALV